MLTVDEDAQVGLLLGTASTPTDPGTKLPELERGKQTVALGQPRS